MNNPTISFPRGPLLDPNTQQISLEWVMFIQGLNSGLFILTQQMSGLQGFASTMLNMSDDSGEDSFMAAIPGPQGATGARGSFVPGMDGQDGDDSAMLASPVKAPDSYRLEGATWEAPGAIGAGTPNTGTFSTLGSAGLTKINANAAALPAGPTGTLLQVGNADGSLSGILADAFAAGGRFFLRRANTSAAAPSALQSAQTIGTFEANGYGATGYSSGARASVQISTTQIWTDTAQGTQILLRTTPNGSATLTTAVTIDQDQSLTGASKVNATTTIRTGGYTVATLPSGTLGDRAYVTDAVAPTFLGLLVGSGTVTTPVFYNGSSWVSD